MQGTKYREQVLHKKKRQEQTKKLGYKANVIQDGIQDSQFYFTEQTQPEW